MGKSIRELVAALPQGRREKVKADAHRMAAEMIAESDSLEALRKAHGKTQAQVAETLGIKQNAVSQLESRTDLYISTLKRYVGALGVELEISLKTKKGVRIPLPNFRPWEGGHLMFEPLPKPPSGKVAQTSKHRAKL